MNDRELDRQARQLVSERNISYWDALGSVVDATALPMAAFSAQPTPAMADDQLDARAKAYARDHGVSYSAALRNVVVLSGRRAQSGASFAGSVAFSAVDDLAQLPANLKIAASLIEIFKAGKHVSNEGESIVFSQADIEDIARNYQPSVREAPLVIGHPELDQPAQGWVGALFATPDGRLQMRAHQVEAAFAEAVKLGRFKKRSAAFYPPSHASNPTPGKWYLRHVGFLGATQPAIAGLKDIAL